MRIPSLNRDPCNAYIVNVVHDYPSADQGDCFCGQPSAVRPQCTGGLAVREAGHTTTYTVPEFIDNSVVGWIPSPIPPPGLRVPIKKKTTICPANDRYIIRISLSYLWHYYIPLSIYSAFLFAAGEDSFTLSKTNMRCSGLPGGQLAFFTPLACGLFFSGPEEMLYSTLPANTSEPPSTSPRFHPLPNHHMLSTRLNAFRAVRTRLVDTEDTVCFP